MELLKLMLEKDPANRISSKEALSHPAFLNVLSKSPLIQRGNFDVNSLIDHTNTVAKLNNKQKLEKFRCSKTQ